MSSSWWTLIRSRLPDPVGGFILSRPERYTSKSTSAAVRGSKMYDFRCVRTVYNFFKIKEKRLWNSLTLLSKFFRLWLSLWVPVSAFGVPSTCWKVTVTTIPAPMLMCHKVTHKNLIDSSPLFRYYLTHTPCNFFVKPIDSDTSEEI